MSKATLGGRARDDAGFTLAIEHACAGDDQTVCVLDKALLVRPGF